jgi:hypothetical protein
MRMGLLRNVDDPNILWDVLTEVTEAAQAQLAPLGFGLTWVLSDE